MEDKIMAALEEPVTINHPIDEFGVPDAAESKVFTTEKNYRLTPTEEEYFQIRKMTEEQRFKGNKDLEDHLMKNNDGFEILEELTENEFEEVFKTENSGDSMDSLESLLQIDEKEKN